MAISLKTIKLLWGRAGNRCVICRRELSIDPLAAGDDESIIGDMAHIIARKEGFTRGDYDALSEQQRDARNLAHMALFPHDERMVNLVSEDAYVRWMDDQNIGVQSYADGLKVLGYVGDSLRRLHLTANAGKSRILSLTDAREHFHFNSNRRLDRLERMPCETAMEKLNARQALERGWAVALQSENKGEWQKVLKRFYRHAARTSSRVLLRRVGTDIKTHAALVERVTDYMRYVASVAECIDVVESLLKDPEQVYGDVNYRLLESLLKLEPNRAEATRIRQLAQRLLNGERWLPGIEEWRVLAPLLLMR